MARKQQKQHGDRFLKMMDGASAEMHKKNVSDALGAIERDADIEMFGDEFCEDIGDIGNK